MAKSKMKTSDWILEGFDSKADWEKAHGSSSSSDTKKSKTFKVRKCPECESGDVKIVLSNSDFEEESNTGKEWECKNCKWKGIDVNVEELDEEEFMKYLDEKGVDVA